MRINSSRTGSSSVVDAFFDFDKAVLKAEGRAKLDDLVSKKLPDMVDANEVRRHPPGMKAVIVNGATVVEDGENRDVFPGKVRRQQLCLS